MVLSVPAWTAIYSRDHPFRRISAHPARIAHPGGDAFPDYVVGAFRWRQIEARICATVSIYWPQRRRDRTESMDQRASCAAGFDLYATLRVSSADKRTFPCSFMLGEFETD